MKIKNKYNFFLKNLDNSILIRIFAKKLQNHWYYAFKNRIRELLFNKR